MYIYTILLLRFLGKRSMGQLSTLELAIIICFGSAVGDPMMGIDIPILHGMVVITTVAFLQVGTEWLINRNKKLEAVMEGRPDCLVKNGMILTTSLERNKLSHEDLFRVLRGKDIEQLGEVKNAFFETSGMISVWCFTDTNIRPGLGIIPEEYIPEEHYRHLRDSVEIVVPTAGILIYLKQRSISNIVPAAVKTNGYLQLCHQKVSVYVNRQDIG